MFDLFIKCIKNETNESEIFLWYFLAPFYFKIKWYFYKKHVKFFTNSFVS